jgi:hypothetical protein
MSGIVAERVFRNVESGAPVTARIYAPEKVEQETEWSCKIEVLGLPAPYEKSIIGVDSFQALCGGLRVLCAHLDQQEARLAFLNGPDGDCDLPLFVSWSYGLQLKAEVKRLIQDKIADSLDAPEQHK